MISHLSGKLVSKSPTALVVECNGIGYEVNISLNTYSKIIDSEQIKIYTHLQVREDSHSIFGFFDELERSVFRLLISVSGIGANTARTMLSSMPPNRVIESIQSDNVVAIQSIKGIGITFAVTRYHCISISFSQHHCCKKISIPHFSKCIVSCYTFSFS